MLIEAVEAPIRYKWPKGEIRLEPGKPVFFDKERGRKVLAKCGPKVRVVQPDWESAWRELSQLTLGLEKTDLRFDLIMTLLDQCDEAFLKGDWEGFERVAEGLKENL